MSPPARTTALVSIDYALFCTICKCCFHNVSALTNCTFTAYFTASKVCCDEGFYAAKGWDPLTGFGSVNYKNFHSIFAKL